MTSPEQNGGSERHSANGAERSLHDAPLPVLAHARPALELRPPNASPQRSRVAVVAPAVQAAAAAAGGFLAGAALVGLVHRRQRRAPAPVRPRRTRRRAAAAKGSGRAARAEELVQIVGTRSLLVDVHLLGER